jgi:predicted transcriptional regulator
MEAHPGPGIRRERLGVGMDQTELAKCIGRSSSYLSQFERGRIDATPVEIAAMHAAIISRRQVAVAVHAVVGVPQLA